MTLLELYQTQSSGGKKGENARALLSQTHWFTVNAVFDPKTGNALPQVLSSVLAKVARPATVETHHDRLWRITEHARLSLERLFRALNESPRREHAMLPVRAVRELDAGSFIKLGNRPGRNIREKLAGKPYLDAVRRFQSVDLPENRLLKTFVVRLAELLELRRDCLCEKEDELLPGIRSWLFSDEAKTIARWDNLPPNNTLLSHHDYRRVWDAWRWLQTLDDDIDHDFSQLEYRERTVRLWNDYGRMYLDGNHLFAEMPVLFDFERFDIRLWTAKIAVQQVGKKITRTFVKNDTEGIREPVCVDLAVLRPQYAVTKTVLCLPETYLWQRWKNEDEFVDIDLFNSDAASLLPDAISISSKDLFFSKDNTREHLDLAARTFASKLRESFTNDVLIWLVPDYLNDFELEIARRNINARFRGAQPLPRSVAAVFEQVDSARITKDGYAIVVVDTIGGKTSVTKLLARFDPDLGECLPETNGFYWERCPTVIFSCMNEAQGAEKERRYEMITLDGNGQWSDGASPERPLYIEPNTLRSDRRIGQFAYCLNMTQSPVVGGIRLHALQKRARGIPLWRDRIPEISIKVMKDGRYRRFYLVARDTRVKPIRGLSVGIPVQERFTLRAGKMFYQFPLFQGENAEELGFSARLDSPSFPLKHDAECNLDLTFEYGVDEPYCLVFSPLDKSFPPVRATWQRTVEAIVTDAPWPRYPEPKSWTDLRNVPKPDSQDTSDLLEWVLGAIERLDADLFIRPETRVFGTLTSEWKEDKNGHYFSYATCLEAESDVFIHQQNFVKGTDFLGFHRGDEVSFELRNQSGKYKGLNVAAPTFSEKAGLRKLDNEETEKLIQTICKRLFFPVIQVWRDGRSVTDGQCPESFAKKAKEKIAYLADLVNLNEVPQSVKKVFFFLLACMHKDTTEQCVKWIADQVEGSKIHDPRAVGFALGDVSEGWQQSIFRKLASDPDNSAVSVFAYAIWREQHFVEKFSIDQLERILNALSQCLTDSIDLSKLKRMKSKEKDITRSLELMLGLLRTRASIDHEIKMFLQPHQKIAKKLAEQIDKVEDFLGQSDINRFSRVQLNIQKPDGVRTPELLYALRLYLTGDDGANAIHIASVSDDENE